MQYTMAEEERRMMQNANGREIIVDSSSILSESVAEPQLLPSISKTKFHQQLELTALPAVSACPIEMVILEEVGAAQEIKPEPNQIATADPLHEELAVGDAPYQEPLTDETLDDEATLDDEERDAVADEGELDELERLSELPIEELLKLYGAPPGLVSVAPTQESGESSSRRRRKERLQITEVFQGSNQEPRSEPTSSGTGTLNNDDEDWSTTSEDEDDEDDVDVNDQLELFKLLSAIDVAKTGGTSSDDSNSDDEEFIPVHLLMLKRDVPVGPTHQVEPEEVDPTYQEVTSDPADEILQWVSRVPENEVTEFLKAAYIQERELLKKDTVANQSEQAEVADDEEFLKEFLDCNYDKDEALRRCRRNFRPGRYESSKWSERECEDFEAAIVDNWKRFNAVQAAVPTRSVKEVIEFYYRWKKSSRFEVFLSRINKLPDGKTHHHLEEKIKIRIGKKRPFDAMDAVAEDQLAVLETNGATVESRQKNPRLDPLLTRQANMRGGSADVFAIAQSADVTEKIRHDAS